MSEKRPIPPSTRGKSTHGVVRSVALRYLFVLAAVATLIVVDQAVIQPMLVRMNAFAPAINVAGRQRMLSQRLTKAALLLRDADNSTAHERRLVELQESLQQFVAEHNALLHGSPDLGIRPIQSAELDTRWARLEPHFQAMVAAARDLIRIGRESKSIKAIVWPVAVIVEHETQFLPIMDRIVKLMEAEAARAVFRLRTFALAISTAVVVLLIGLGWFVVRPATRTIRLQVDELECRVVQRTRELSAALESLQHEVRQRELAELRHQRISAQLSHAERVSTMGHLTAGLAHELNQPLAAIANYTEACDILMGESPPGESMGTVRDYIRQAKRAALRAGQIVRRMRNFVRPNADTTAEVGINQLVSEIVELCRTEATNMCADMSLELSADPDVVAADPIQIQQVMVNLVQNSLQAMRDNIGPRHIIIRTSAADSLVQIDVLDSGPGFSSIHPDAVFAPFQTTKQEGLGIGLSICRSIVENHKGSIWTESPRGRGAQVSFTLPLAAVYADPIRIQPDCLCCR
jgi:C4-dicarboxylate-specific signal transduction histidine kinase